jgi:HAD superfamily hydrolase (TIGR01509 family)
MGVWSDIDIAFLRKRGIDACDDYTDRISSMSFPEAAAYTIKRFGLPDSAENIMREWNDMAMYAYGHTVGMKPHAKEYLAALREGGAKLAIATSSVPELYEPALNKHGIYDWFDVICDSNETGCSKSSPDIFLLAANKLGVQPRDCVVFEDILVAVKSAKSVGMTVYGVFDKASQADWEKIKETADGAILDFSDAPLLK